MTPDHAHNEPGHRAPVAIQPSRAGSLNLVIIRAVRIPSRKLLVRFGAIGAIVLVAVFIEAPPRSVPADERIPESIIIRQHQKFGGRELVTLTNHEDIMRVMTALPSSYRGAYCACFGYFNLEFYAATGVYRTVNYMPGDYLRDSEHRTGQASVPRRFRRIVGGMIAQHELSDTAPIQDGASNGSQPLRAETNQSPSATGSSR